MAWPTRGPFSGESSSTSVAGSRSKRISRWPIRRCAGRAQDSEALGAEHPAPEEADCVGVNLDLLRSHAGVSGAVEAQAVLQAPKRAVRVSVFFRDVFFDQPEAGGNLQEGDVAEVLRQLRVAVRVRQDQVLHRELDVDHAAAVVLQ